MPFRFYIDGQLTDQPVGDTDLRTVIKRNSDLGALLVTQEAQITYDKNNAPAPGEVSGYALLKTLWDAGICSEYDIEIYDEVSQSETHLTFRGTLKVPEFELDEQRVTIRTKIRDASFYAYVSNNKNVKYSLYSNNTKSKLLISPPPLYEVDMMNSATGDRTSTIGNTYRGYRLYDVFQFVVAAISDNKVTFESFYLQLLRSPLFLFAGDALLNANTDPVFSEITFAELINETFKLKNVSFYIDGTNPELPVLRLEDSNYFFQSNEVYQFDDIKDLLTTVKTGEIYGTVRVGSDFNPGGASPVYTFNSGTSYFGWKGEVYTPIGQCNTDAELNLETGWIIASNAINDKIIGGSTENLDKWHVVECDDFSVDTINHTAEARRYSYFGIAPPFFYNLGLNNFNRLQLHGNNFQTALNNTQEISGEGFRAALGQDTVGIDGSLQPLGTVVEIEPIIFADEFSGANYDGDGNYNNVNGHFTVPSDGVWSFSSFIELDVTGLVSCSNVTVTIISSPYVPAAPYPGLTVFFGIGVTITITAYTDATLVTEVGSSSANIGIITNGEHVVSTNFAGNLTAGNVVVVKSEAYVARYAPALLGILPLQAPNAISTFSPACGFQQGFPPTAIIHSESYYECNGTPDGGITVSAPSPDGYKALIHKFDQHIDESSWREIVANPIGMFPFEKDGITRYGWLDEMSHSNWNGQTTIILNSSTD